MKSSIKEKLERLDERRTLYQSQLNTVEHLIEELESQRITLCDHDFDPHVCKKCGMYKTDPDYQTYLFKRKYNV